MRTQKNPICVTLAYAYAGYLPTPLAAQETATLKEATVTAKSDAEEKRHVSVNRKTVIDRTETEAKVLDISRLTMKFQAACKPLLTEDTALAISVGVLAALAVSVLSLIVIEIVELLRQLGLPFPWGITSLFSSFLPYHP